MKTMDLRNTNVYATYYDRLETCQEWIEKIEIDKKDRTVKDIYNRIAENLVADIKNENEYCWIVGYGLINDGACVSYIDNGRYDGNLHTVQIKLSAKEYMEEDGEEIAIERFIKATDNKIENALV